jgi:tight adherence protein B
MRRRLSLALLLSVAALAAGASAAGTPGGPGLTRLASVHFPYRAFVFTAAQPVPLTPGSVVVHENGRSVNGVSIVPASAAGASGTVLLLDASNSMRGAPIAHEMKAARVFVARNPNQPLAVIALNDRVTSVLGFTTNHDRIRKALATQPKNREGTHIYDAIVAAVRQLKSAHLRAGRIVLLSDGQEVRSTVSRETALKAAKNAGVRIYTIGLVSYAFDAGYLKGLSTQTGASYAEATAPKQLEKIYGELGVRFANEYLLRYRSLAGPSTTVHVKVAATGVSGIGTSSYTTPALPANPAPPYHRSFGKRFVQSPGSVAALSLFVALLVWYAVRALFRRRESNLRQRIGEFSTERREREVKRHLTSPRTWFQESVVPSAERFFQRYSWWERLEEELEIGKFPVRPVPLAALAVVGTILTAILLGLIAPILALLGLTVPLFVRSLYKSRLKQQRDAFAEQLPGNLQILAASLRAGHSFVSALSSVVDEAEEPSSSELRRAVSDEQLGVPIEDALLRVAERMDSGDLEQVALVASLQRETGGNTAEVLDAVVDACRERFELQRLVKALTAQGRLSRWVLTGVPVAVALIISVLNPGYLRPLFTTQGGQIMLAIAVTFVLIGSHVIKRITDIEI